MAYSNKNNNNSYQNNYNGNYNGKNNNYQSSYSNNNNNNQQCTKKSGVVYSLIKQGVFEGLTIVNAWMKSKDYLLTLKIAPYNKTQEIVKSKSSGREYLK